jgi:peptide/nickel transport system permease protein
MTYLAPKNNRTPRLFIWWVYGLIGICLFANILANHQPLVANYQQQIIFPAFTSIGVDWGLINPKNKWMPANDPSNRDYRWAIFPPIPYSPTDFDRNNIHAVSPFAKQQVPSFFWRHWLGTDELGRDILSGIIHGTQTALWISTLAMSIACLLGILLGSLAGYYGDDRMRLSLASLLVMLFFVMPAGVWLIYVKTTEWMNADANQEVFTEISFLLFLLILITLLAWVFSLILKQISFLKKKIFLPADIIISRAIELTDALPIFLIIVSLSAMLLQPSLSILAVIIGLFSWTTIAKLIRSEMLRIRELEYIEAARVMGFSPLRIIFKHALPHAIRPVWVTVSFGIASVILFEASLSFLGIGVPADKVTWGSLLASAQQSPSSWWLALFPGTAIFIMAYLFNKPLS